MAASLQAKLAQSVDQKQFTEIQALVNKLTADNTSVSSEAKRLNTLVLQLTAERGNSEIMVNTLRQQITALAVDKEHAARLHQSDILALRQELATTQQQALLMKDESDEIESRYEANVTLKETLIRQAQEMQEAMMEREG